MPTAGEYKHEPIGIPCHCYVRRRLHACCKKSCLRKNIDINKYKRVSFSPVLNVRSFENNMNKYYDEFPMDTTIKESLNNINKFKIMATTLPILRTSINQIRKEGCKNNIESTDDCSEKLKNIEVTTFNDLKEFTFEDLNRQSKSYSNSLEEKIHIHKPIIHDKLNTHFHDYSLKTTEDSFNTENSLKNLHNDAYTMINESSNSSCCKNEFLKEMNYSNADCSNHNSMHLEAALLLPSEIQELFIGNKIKNLNKSTLLNNIIQQFKSNYIIHKKCFRYYISWKTLKIIISYLLFWIGCAFLILLIGVLLFSNDY